MRKSDRPREADPVINRDYRTPRGWRLGHLQSIRSRVLPHEWRLDDVSNSEPLLLELGDGSLDRVSVILHHPFQPVPNRMLVLLIHGLGGSAESNYIRATARGLLSVGFPVARMDLRGAGLSGDHSAGLYHAGRTEDVRTVIESLEAWAHSGIAAMGFSLGGNLVLKLAGEPDGPAPLRAAIAVSAPLDLSVGADHLHSMMFGFYEQFVMNGLREDTARPGPASGLTPQEAEVIRHARSIVEFDDAITAPRNGWQDAAEYYAVNSSGQFLPRIQIPTLVIHALDDPMVPAQPYRDIDWETIESAGYVRRAVTAHGGHVGFHERGRAYPWFVPQAVRFLTGPATDPA